MIFKNKQESVDDYWRNAKDIHDWINRISHQLLLSVSYPSSDDIRELSEKISIHLSWYKKKQGEL